MAQRVGRGIALLFHDCSTRRGRVVSSTPRPHFTPEKYPVPILQEAGWAPGPVWTGGKSRPHRDSIPDRPARSSVAIPTELPGPQVHGENNKNVSESCSEMRRKNSGISCSRRIGKYYFTRFPKEEKKGCTRETTLQHFHVFCVINLCIIDSYLEKRA